MRRLSAMLPALMQSVPWFMCAALVVGTLLYPAFSPDGRSLGLIEQTAQAQSAGPCGLSHPVFCETFDRPAGTGDRAGQLNGTLWGVSRASGFVNIGQSQHNAWMPTPLQTCGGTITAQPPNDVIICNGQVREAVNDDTGVTTLAMYPKQPFDFAGRTGIVTFDVSNDTQGGHTAWPEFWISDQPVPTPFTHLGSWLAAPRHGFGIRLSASTLPFEGKSISQTCPKDNHPRWSIESVVVTRNYVVDDQAWNGSTKSQMLDCVIGSSGPGDMNHVEIHISQSLIDVYATDAGTQAPLHHIATVPNANLSFSRGLVWLEDVHYNANKFGQHNQRSHTFAWDNLGFDGPALPRDLAFDVLDTLAPVGDGHPGEINLGWMELPNEATPRTINGVTGIQNAGGALLTFNFFQTDQAPASLDYSVNGHTHSVNWPYPDTTAPSGGTTRTLAVPVPLADVVPGTNIVSVSAAQPLVYSNMDLILVGAGGVVGPGGGGPDPSVRPPSTGGDTGTHPRAGGSVPAAPPLAPPVPPVALQPEPPAALQPEPPAALHPEPVVAVVPPPVPADIPPPAAPVAAAPVSLPNPQMLSLGLVGSPLLHSAVDALGGQLIADQFSVVVPANAVSSASAELDVLSIDPHAVPAPADGFQLGSGAFVITLMDPTNGAHLSPASPLTLQYRLTSDDINRVNGDLTRVKVGNWVDGSWAPLNCTFGGTSLDCTVPHLNLFALILAPPPSDTLDTPLAGGWLYKQANGYHGAGDAGFAVVDDDDANFWTELQRLGGVERLGYPISRRFEHAGYTTQAFQKTVLQWHPELGFSVPLRVFDELTVRGSDTWLDVTRQVPPAVDTGAGAAAQPTLDPYPALRDFYDADPQAREFYGLPVSIKDYGNVVTVRLQRATLQLWTANVPWADAGTVIVGNAGEIAKDAGLWSASESAPTPALYSE